MVSLVYPPFFLIVGWQVGIVSPADTGQWVRIPRSTVLEVFQAASRFRAKVRAWLVMSAVGEAGLQDEQCVLWSHVTKHVHVHV